MSHLAKMSVSSRQYILSNWLQMYQRSSVEGRNGVLRQCTDSFPDFAGRMRANLRLARPGGFGVSGIDEAFEKTMTSIYEGSAPIRVRRR